VEAANMQTCKTCGSKAPHLHPAVQVDGEVEVCGDSFHLTITPQNTLRFIFEVERKRMAQEAARKNRNWGPAMWQTADTAPVDREILLCHDNGKAGLFFGTGWISHDGTWFEGDAMTPMKLPPTHWMEIPPLPHEAERLRKINDETERQLLAGLDTLISRNWAPHMYQLHHKRGCSCPNCAALREVRPAVASQYGQEHLIAAIRAVDVGLEKLAEGTPVAWSRIGRLRIELREAVSDNRILAPMAADVVAEIKRLSQQQ
jgi:hypothetical protein